MTCPYVFKDFANVIDGQLLSSAKVTDDTAVELRSKSDSTVSLLLPMLAVGGLAIICGSTINSLADSRAESQTCALAEEPSSGGTSSVLDLFTGGGGEIISSATGEEEVSSGGTLDVSELGLGRGDLLGDLLGNKRVAVIDLATMEIFCVLVALVPVLPWWAEVSSDVGIANAINLSLSFSSEGGLELLTHFQLLNQPISHMTPQLLNC